VALEAYNTASLDEKQRYEQYDLYRITYTGKSIGRYYIYTMDELEHCPIFFNKYTAEIFSSSPGVPIFSLAEGFISMIDTGQ